jgi:hypothetical protein
MNYNYNSWQAKGHCNGTKLAINHLGYERRKKKMDMQQY